MLDTLWRTHAFWTEKNSYKENFHLYISENCKLLPQKQPMATHCSSFFPICLHLTRLPWNHPAACAFVLDFLTWYAVHRWQVWGACWRGVIIRAGHSFDGIMIERCRAGHGKFGHPGHHNGEGILGEGWLWRHCVRTARGKISRESHRSRLADCGRRWTTFGKKKKKKRERISIFLLFTVFLKLNSFPLEISKTRNLFYCKILHD